MEESQPDFPMVEKVEEETQAPGDVDEQVETSVEVGQKRKKEEEWKEQMLKCAKKVAEKETLFLSLPPPFFRFLFLWFFFSGLLSLWAFCLLSFSLSLSLSCCKL